MILPRSEILAPNVAAITELQETCEKARERLRSDAFLETFLGYLGAALLEGGLDSLSLTRRILQTTPAKYLAEDIVRDFMRKLGLPEEEFVVLRAHDFKEVIHEISEETRKELVAQNTQMAKVRKFRQRMNAVLPFKKKLVYTQVLPMYSGAILLTDGESIPKFGPSFRLRITYSCPEVEFRQLKQSLIDSGWKTPDLQLAKYNDIERIIEFMLDESITIAKDRLANAISPFRLRARAHKID